MTGNKSQMWLFKFYLFFAIVLCQFMTLVDGYAQISPGDLARPHAFLEGMTNCIQCHELGGGPSADKCLACHLEIKMRLQERRGLHHKMVTLDRKACFSCHSDHAGREFQMIHWVDGREIFDHAQTGYLLNGKHGQLQCRDCHKPEFIQEDLRKAQPKIDLKETFLGLRKDCMTCHHDEHRGQLGSDCLNCHTESAWQPANRFDHNRAKFRLTGKHLAVDCIKCHPRIRDNNARPPAKTFFTKFTGLQFGSCNACHTDVHKGKLGSDCQSCHNTNGWQNMSRTTFDHSKTRFPLLGKHRQVECLQCHKSGDVLRPLPFSSCASCHEDVHKGNFGNDCKSCHNASGWKKFSRANFDHSMTGFPLRGLHAQVDCIKCHTSGNMTLALESEQCSDCHQDVHLGQFAKRADGGRCESCHHEQGFIPALFGIDEHQKTAFPLLGAHLAAECRACHKMAKMKADAQTRLFLFPQASCKTCHHDAHFGQFTKIKPVKTCEVCHNPTEWIKLTFNHDTDSRFQLEGAHRQVDCNRCHKRVKYRNSIFRLYRPIDQACETCHSGDGIRLKKRRR